jgi:ABC-type lipoprotein export system ATPase subunit/GNAT superfamily N-acetyltransferase
MVRPTEHWQNLVRSAEPLVSLVEMDRVTENLIRPFDYSSTGEERFYPFLVPEDLPSEFSIGVIVGASGTGKSTLLANFGKTVVPDWGDGSIASHFLNSEEAAEKFAAVGLMSVPDWVKKYSALSNGQKFRANLARQLSSGIAIDEYSSVVDRNVARASSAAMSRYIRKKNLKNIVLATVHRDVLEFLEPDWVIDTDKGQWSSGRWLQRPSLDFSIYPASYRIWSYFAPYHYLSEKHNDSAHCYIAIWEGKLVGFNSVLSFPTGVYKNAWRAHRLVIHPDFQGFGFGPTFSEAVAQHYLDNGKRYFAKTAHPRLGKYRDESPKWRPTVNNHKSGKRTHSYWNILLERKAYSHEYIGE